MVTIVTREYTIKVRALAMKARILKQLPRLSTMTAGEADGLEPVCWFQSSMLERDHIGKSLLMYLEDEAVVIPTPQNFMQYYKVEGRKVLWNDREVPFAVVL